MAEMAKKSGGTRKKAAAGAASEAPVLLADGKTPASPEALRKALGKFGLPTEGGTMGMVERVRSLLTSKIQEVGHVCSPQCRDDLTSNCPKVLCACEEISVAPPVNPNAPPLPELLQAVTTDYCPFCGDSGMTPEEATATAAPAPAVTPPAPPPPADEPTETPAPGGMGLEAPLPPLASTEPEAPAASEGTVVEPSNAPADEPPAALAPAVEVLPPEEKDRVPELEESIDAINKLKDNLAENSYDLGLKLREVQEKDLWKARKDESGALKYKNWSAWVEAEIGISRSLAFDLVKLTSEFSRQTFLEVGKTRLSLVARIEDPEARAAVLAQARAGASTRTVERLAHESNGTGGETAPPERESDKKGAAPASEPSKSSAPPPKSNEIKLLAKVDGRPRNYTFTSAKTGKTLKSHQPDSFIEVRLTGNVVQHIALKMDETGTKVLGATVAFIEVAEPS